MIKAQAWSLDQNVLPGERRRHQRVPIHAQIEIRPGGMDVPMRMETTDLSQGGCYVEMALTLDIGTKLDIVLWLDGQKVSTRGVVVTRHPQFGNGIEFVGIVLRERAQTAQLPRLSRELLACPQAARQTIVDQALRQ